MSLSGVVDLLANNLLAVSRIAQALRAEGYLDERRFGRIQRMPDFTMAAYLLEILLTIERSGLETCFRHVDPSFRYIYEAIQVSLTEIGEHATRRLSDCIRDMKCSRITFYRQLFEVHCVLDATSIRLEGASTLLHDIILHGRADFLRPLQYLGLWSRLRHETIPWSSESEYRGRLPGEVAATLGVPQVVAELQAIDSEESNMPEIEKIVRSAEEDTFLRRLTESRTDTFNRKLLSIACQSGSLNMVLCVIENEQKQLFPRTSVDDEVRTAVRLGHAYILPVLMEYKTSNINSLLLDNKPIIYHSASLGHWDTFRILTNLKAQIPPYILPGAASRGHQTFCENLLRFHRSIDINYRDKRGKTALMFAVENDHSEVVEVLLKYNADMMIPDCRNYNVLHACCSSRNTRTLDILLSAARERCLLEHLLKQRSRYLGIERCFLVRGNESGDPVWQYVEVERAIIDLFRSKVKEGSLVPSQYGKILRSGPGQTPPTHAAKEMVERCDILNVKRDAPDDMLPIHVAMFKDNNACAARLLEFVHDVNQPDCFGLTSLHLACMRGNRQLVLALLEKGADSQRQDLHGRTPARVARLNNHGHLVDLLQSDLMEVEDHLWRTPTAPSTFPRMEDARVIECATAANERLKGTWNELRRDRLREVRRSGHDPSEHVHHQLSHLRDDLGEFISDYFSVEPTTTELYPTSPRPTNSRGAMARR